MDDFLKAYVNRFKYSTVTSVEWKVFFLEFFEEEVCKFVHACMHVPYVFHRPCLSLLNTHIQAQRGVFDGVEWDKWFYQPGMPPFNPE